MPYPSPPWRMRGQLWMSVFRVPADAHPDRPAGMYGVALVDYQPGSVLTYHELLVARPVRREGRHVTVTDIWVDSQASLEGGRSLWAVPKDLADFALSIGSGPLRRTAGTMSVDGHLVASASFRDTTAVAVRTPYSGTTWQRRDDGGSVVAHLRGSSRALPCLGRWTFASDGPLGWLAGRKPLVSFAMRDFTMTFG